MGAHALVTAVTQDNRTINVTTTPDLEHVGWYEVSLWDQGMLLAALGRYTNDEMQALVHRAVCRAIKEVL